MARLIWMAAATALLASPALAQAPPATGAKPSSPAPAAQKPAPAAAAKAGAPAPAKPPLTPGAKAPSPEVTAAVAKANAGDPSPLFKLADAGNADAQFFAGGILVFGLKDIPRDAAKGCAYEEKAGVTRGDAMHLVGECYRRGLAGKLDKDKAAAAYTKAIDMGYGKSRCVLGEMLFDNAKQAERGLMLCKAAADSGDVEAQAKVGGFYYRGNGPVKPDLRQARRYYELAAKQKNPESMRKLGEMYAKGEGGGRDTKKAMEVWTAAEKGGDPMVAILVADHLFGQLTGGKAPGPGQYAFKNGIPTGDIAVVEDWYKLAEGHDPRPDVKKRATYALTVLKGFKQAGSVQTTKSSPKGKGAPPPKTATTTTSQAGATTTVTTTTKKP